MKPYYVKDLKPDEAGRLEEFPVRFVPTQPAQLSLAAFHQAHGELG